MTILFIVLGVLALPFAIAFFLKKEYTVQRETEIDAAPGTVFNYVKFVKNTAHFSKWVMQDSDSRKEYVGTDGTVGFVFKWDSDDKQVGKGEQEIIAINEGGRIEFEIRFIKPFEGRSIAWMETIAISEHRTRLTWVFNGKMKYPMNIITLFMNMDKVLGNDMEISLENLKNILESR